MKHDSLKSLNLRPRLKKGLCIALSISIAFSGSAAAGNLDAALNDMYVSTTSADYIKLQGSNVLVGGSLTARTSTQQINVLYLDPPHAYGSCSGIDIYFGAFSFINKDQIIALMKKIANNAKGLLFKMAIDSLSPKLGSLLQEFSNKVNQLNSAFKNSCYLASAITGVDIDKPTTFANALGNISAKTSAVAGEVTGWFDGLVGGDTKGGSEQAKPNSDVKVTTSAPGSYGGTTTTTMRQDSNGNLMWRALIASGVGSKGSFGSAYCSAARGYMTAGYCSAPLGGTGMTTNLVANLYYLVMGITGTQIVGSKDQTRSNTPAAGSSSDSGSAPGQTGANPAANVLTKMLQFNDLLAPASNNNRVLNTCVLPSYANGTGMEPPDYDGNGDPTCMSMVPRPTQEIFGGTLAATSSDMDLLVSYILAGGSTSSAPAQQVTDKARINSFLATTPLPLLSYLRSVQSNEAALRGVAELLKPIVARAKAIALARDLIQIARVAHGTQRQESIRMPDDYQKNLNAFEAEVNAEVAKLDDTETANKLQQYVVNASWALSRGSNTLYVGAKQ